jgi:hypothetical protein
MYHGVSNLNNPQVTRPAPIEIQPVFHRSMLQSEPGVSKRSVAAGLLDS